MTNYCGKCLDHANLKAIDCTENDRTFDLYFCETCGKVTFVFTSPQTEREVVLVALVEDALSAESSVVMPQREKNVEAQLRLWSDEPRVWY